jgi:hypothetical protein
MRLGLIPPLIILLAVAGNVGATICRYMVVKHANPEDMTKVDKSIFLSYIFVGGMGAMYTLIFIFGWGG